MSLLTCYFGRQSRPFRNFSPEISVTALMRFGEFKGSIKEKGYTKGFFTMDDKKQEMKNKKQKYAYWMRPSLVAEMTEMLESANATSKSDFVCQAVEFYIGYLRQQNYAMRSQPTAIIQRKPCSGCINNASMT